MRPPRTAVAVALALSGCAHVGAPCAAGRADRCALYVWTPPARKTTELGADGTTPLSSPQQESRARARQALHKILAARAGGWTRFETLGGWVDAKGNTVEESGLVYFAVFTPCDAAAVTKARDEVTALVQRSDRGTSAGFGQEASITWVEGLSSP
jgi:hypothetical protein